MKTLRNIIQEKLIINKGTRAATNNINELISFMFNDTYDDDLIFNNSSDFNFVEEVNKLLGNEYHYINSSELALIRSRIKNKFAYVPSVFPKDKFEKVIVKNNVMFSGQKMAMTKLYHLVSDDKNWTTIKMNYMFKDWAVMSTSEEYLIFFIYSSQEDSVYQAILVKF